jgi:Flp pilus assembly pilin Flp
MCGAQRALALVLLAAARVLPQVRTGDRSAEQSAAVRQSRLALAREEGKGRLTREIHMKAMNFVGKLIKDEQGGEVLEYALIAGLIVVASIAMIATVGGKVLARWGSLNSSM